MNCGTREGVKVEKGSCKSAIHAKGCTIQSKTLTCAVGSVVIGIYICAPTELSAAICLQNLSCGRAIGGWEGVDHPTNGESGAKSYSTIQCRHTCDLECRTGDATCNIKPRLRCSIADAYVSTTEVTVAIRIETDVIGTLYFKCGVVGACG